MRKTYTIDVNDEKKDRFLLDFLADNEIEFRVQADTQTLQYPLPTDAKERREKLIDLEDNVGVIVSIKDNIAMVKAYHKK